MNDTRTVPRLRFRCCTVDSLPPCASIVIHAKNAKSDRLKSRIQSARPDIKIAAILDDDWNTAATTEKPAGELGGELLPQCDGVTNRTDWIQTAWRLIDVGCNCVHALPVFDPLDSYRNCIVVPDKRVIFVPVYKSAYSSFTEFFRAAFSENFAERKGSLNSYVDLRDPTYQGYFKFSVVREPLGRAFSCFVDKYGRSGSHHNVELWQRPLLRLVERESITFAEWLELICSIPDSHADPHWRSQHATLFDASGPLVNEVFHLEYLADCLAELSERLSMPVNLQRLNATRAAPDYSDEARQLIHARYRDDFKAFGY